MGKGDGIPYTGSLTLSLAADVSASEELAPGTIAGSYTIVETIGRGGFGTVYRATQDQGGRRAAVKVLHEALAVQPAAVERFMREVHILNRIRHPNIIEIYEVGNLNDGRPFFAMELFEGTNLRRILQSDGRMSPVEAFETTAQVCGALEVAHANGVIHRDLKAENVLVSPDRAVKLVDFGVAKLLEPTQTMPGLTSTHQIVGTVVAMAPEQLRSQPLDPRTDVYGLGVLLYDMLTGVLPFRGSPHEVVQMHLETPPQPPSSLAPLPPPLDAVVMRCLEKDPSARFSSVPELLEQLRTAIYGNQAPTTARVAIGVLVSAVPRHDSSDEDALVQAAEALDLAESTLRAAGYPIAVQTSREILAVVVAPVTPEAQIVARVQAISVARRLRETVTASVDDSVLISITVNSDMVHVRDGTGELVGGPLLEIGTWSWPHGDVFVTPRVSAGLPTV